MVLSNLESKILVAVQNGMPLSITPYQDLAKSIGIPVMELLDILRQWQADGKIRRLGAVVNHFQMGHGFGAMVAWNIPAEKIDTMSLLFASFTKVSHAYQRPSQKNWPYNLYTMVHASSDGELVATIQTMSQKSGNTNFCVLKTVKELKKTSPTYILEQ